MITAITATVPARRQLFAELVDSMARQTLPPEQWLIEWDYAKRGPVAVLNGLADKVTTEWLFRIDDDDLLEHDHFDTIKPYLTDDVDVVYTPCRVEGVIVHGTIVKEQFDAEKLRKQNIVPAAACVRTSVWQDLGGYRDDVEHEDWDLWLRALDAGARFLCVPVKTWTYRLGNQWQHRSA